jgi:hypothetical protein
MTEFKQELRHYCRYPQCRSKLPVPVSNPREAFCKRGCYGSFYLHRCRVCEGTIEQNAHEDRKVCKRTKCKNAWQAGHGFGRYAMQKSGNGTTPQKPLILLTWRRREGRKLPPLPATELTPQKTPDFIDSKPALKPDRAWRIIAGPELTSTQLRFATVPDGKRGPDGPTWQDSAWQRIEAKNRAALDAHFDKLDASARDFCAICQRTDDLVDRRVMAADGYPSRGPDQWKTICRDCLAGRNQPTPVPTTAGYEIRDDLSIPSFLRRPQPNDNEHGQHGQNAGVQKRRLLFPFWDWGSHIGQTRRELDPYVERMTSHPCGQRKTRTVASGTG